jgi:uncharacterized membrane protein
MIRLRPQHLRNSIYSLRGGFLVRPLAISLILGLSGGVFPRVEDRYMSRSDLRIFDDLQANLASSILSTIAGGVMTVVSIVFAILLMSLTLASMQFSPRILVGFTRDRVTQWTLGVFLGTFSYCVCALPSVKTVSPLFVPVLTVQGAMMLALISVVWLLFFIHHIAHSISVNYIVDRIASETETTIEEMKTEASDGEVTFLSDNPHRESDSPTQFPLTSGATIPVKSMVSGYIRTINHEKLVRWATHLNVTVFVSRRVGHFVPKGVELLRVQGASKIGVEAHQDLLAAFEIGPTRSLQQDVEFGILQIVDIALRAISPAVNDPSTAISCVDQLARILISFAESPPTRKKLFDFSGTLRVVIPTIGLERMVHSAFDQIRSYSKGDLAVSLRMLRALADLSTTVADLDIRRMLATMGARIVAGCEATLETDELTELRKRQAELDAQAENPQATIWQA